MENKKSYLIIQVSNIQNLDQHGLIDRAPFYFQPTIINNNIDPELLLLNPDLQTYKLCVKRNFYKKWASKSNNIFGLIDSYFTDIIIISSSTDISFNYSMTSKVPIQKYKLVAQAFVNWFSAANWWQSVFPVDKVGIICLTAEERRAVYSYPKFAKGGAQEQIIIKMCARIDNLIKYITRNSPNPSAINQLNKPQADNPSKLCVKFCNSLVNIRPGSELKPSTDTNNVCSGYDVFNYLIQHTGFKKICSQEYQGYVDFLLFNLPPANPELCLSVFIRDNKLIGFSQTDLKMGYSARLSQIITYCAEQLIILTNTKWQGLINNTGQLTNTKWQELINNTGNSSNKLIEYEDVVLTIELIPIPSTENPELELIQGIQIWNIEMGYGAWTQTGSKLFTWAELELITGTPPVIKIMGP
jgi:hypothetical protein